MCRWQGEEKLLQTRGNERLADAILHTMLGCMYINEPDIYNFANDRMSMHVGMTVGNFLVCVEISQRFVLRQSG